MDDLIQRARRGDSDAFIALFEQSRESLWRAAMAVLDNAEDAADALQETTIKAWRAIPRFEGRSNVGTWFMRILLRTCYDLRARRQREAPYAPESFAADAPAAGNARAAGIPDDFRVIVGGRHRADVDEAMDVRSAVGRLSPEDRLVLTLFYVDDFSIRCIAAILDASEGAVRARLSRARSRFKDEYAGNDGAKAEVAR